MRATLLFCFKWCPILAVWKLHVCFSSYRLGSVRHARACPVFSKITKQQYLLKGLSYFVYLLHVVTHPWKVQCYHVILFGYGPACLMFSEATNHISLERVVWFCWFFASSYLHLVRYPLKLQKYAILGCHCQA